MKKIAITGGHLTPALALLPNLQKEYEVLFIGRKYAFEGDSAESFEYKTIKEQQIPFQTITTGRLQRRFSLYTIPSLFKFPYGIMQSFSILRSFKPDVILSFGGYVAAPVALAAFMLGIPIVTHEQTIKAGLANRLIAFFAKKICITFSESQQYFSKEKTVLTGNLIRKELYVVPHTSPFAIEEKKLPIVYITGGSSGSHSINLLVGEILEPLLTKAVVFHQVGSSSLHDDLAMLSRKAKDLPENLQKRYAVQEHVRVEELAWIYHNADILIGRSGANTVYEVLVFGMPSIFIPLPWASLGEQEANARLVEKVGLGKVLLQDTLSSPTLLAAIEEMLKNNKTYKAHKEKGKKLIEEDAQDKILAVLSQVLTK